MQSKKGKEKVLQQSKPDKGEYICCEGCKRVCERERGNEISRSGRNSLLPDFPLWLGCLGWCIFLCTVWYGIIRYDTVPYGVCLCCVCVCRFFGIGGIHCMSSVLIYVF